MPCISCSIYILSSTFALDSRFGGTTGDAPDVKLFSSSLALRIERGGNMSLFRFHDGGVQRIHAHLSSSMRTCGRRHPGCGHGCLPATPHKQRLTTSPSTSSCACIANAPQITEFVEALQARTGHARWHPTSEAMLPAAEPSSRETMAVVCVSDAADPSVECLNRVGSKSCVGRVVSAVLSGKSPNIRRPPATSADEAGPFAS